MLEVNDFVPVIGTDFTAVVVVVICGGCGVSVVFYDVDNVLLLVLHLPHVHIHQCITIWLLYVCTASVVVVVAVAVVGVVDFY